MKKNLTLILTTLFLFVGCHSTPKPSVKEELKITEPKENNVSVAPLVLEKNVSKVLPEHEIEVIKSVFKDEEHFGGNRLKLIDDLVAQNWEKRALRWAYRKNKSLWNREQKETFKVILEKDLYLSLCDSKPYWDNLMLVSGEPEEDILYSVLLLRYLNNLESGCVDWVTENKEMKKRDYVHANYVLNLLSFKVLIDRLFLAYLPEREIFYKSLREYKSLEENGVDKLALKAKRLEVENYKSTKSYPSYE